MHRNDSSLNGRIVVDPRIMAGKPVVQGTRIPVELVLKRLAEDLDLATLYGAFPRLTPDDVRACIAYAQSLVEGEDVFPAPSEPVSGTRARA